MVRKKRKNSILTFQKNSKSKEKDKNLIIVFEKKNHMISKW